MGKGTEKNPIIRGIHDISGIHWICPAAKTAIPSFISDG